MCLKYIYMYSSLFGISLHLCTLIPFFSADFVDIFMSHILVIYALFLFLACKDAIFYDAITCCLACTMTSSHGSTPRHEQECAQVHASTYEMLLDD